MKVCKGCGEAKPLDAFYANPCMSDGRLSRCKPCIVARHGAKRSERARRDRAYFQQIKLERGCVDCGYNAHPAALDFDHLPGVEKLIRVSCMAGASRALIDAEIAKCEVVCANCHRIRTANRLNERAAA